MDALTPRLCGNSRFCDNPRHAADADWALVAGVSPASGKFAADTAASTESYGSGGMTKPQMTKDIRAVVCAVLSASDMGLVRKSAEDSERYSS